MAVTFVLGAAFLAIELHEFADHDRAGRRPERSAFLSAFFALIGCHGLHVTAGLLWLLTMMAQVVRQGLPRRHPAPHALLQPVLAHPRHHLGGAVQPRLPRGSRAHEQHRRRTSEGQHGDIAPGDEHGRATTSATASAATSIGFALATGLTVRLVLHRPQHAGLGAEHPDRAVGAGDRADGRAPRLLPAHDLGARQRQQPAWRSPSAC